MRHIIPYLIALLLSCGSQTASNKDTASNAVSVKEERPIAISQTTSLTITSGSAAGSSVSLTIASVPSGTQNPVLSLDRVDTPEIFNNVQAGIHMTSAASSSVEVALVDKDAIGVTTLAVAMTLALPYTSVTALTAVSRVDANLCVFLLTPDSEFYVFRRSAISIFAKEKLAKISSSKTGVFQLVFCGSDSIQGTQDASINGVASRPPASSSDTNRSIAGTSRAWFGAPSGNISLTLSPKKWGHSTKSNYCIGVGYSKNVDPAKEIYLASFPSLIEDTVFNAALDVTVIPDEAKAFIRVFVQGRDAVCDLLVKEPVFQKSYKFMFTIDELKGKIVGTFGEGSFLLKSYQLKTELLGPSPRAEKVCLGMTTSSAGLLLGESFTSATIDTDGSLLGVTDQLFVPSQSDVKVHQRLSMVVGGNCGTKVGSYDGKSKPYLIMTNEAPLGTLSKIEYVHMNSSLSQPASGVYCVSLYPGNYTGSTVPTTGDSNVLLARWEIVPNTTYGFYIPKASTYDIQYVSDTCSNSTDLGEFADDVPLSSNISF